MGKQYNCNVCTRAQSEEMCPVGVSREATREAVRKKLCIGQQYQLKSVNATEKDEQVDAVCTLLEMGRNILIFKHRNGMREGFTYQDIWKQMSKGDFI